MTLVFPSVPIRTIVQFIAALVLPQKLPELENVQQFFKVIVNKA